MTEERRKYLSDITLANDRIENSQIEMGNFPSFEMAIKTQSAVERQLAIIGQDLRQSKKFDPKIKVQNDKKTIVFKKRLIHGYDEINNAIVWRY